MEGRQSDSHAAGAKNVRVCAAEERPIAFRHETQRLRSGVLAFLGQTGPLVLSDGPGDYRLTRERASLRCFQVTVEAGAAAGRLLAGLGAGK